MTTPTDSQLARQSDVHDRFRRLAYGSAFMYTPAARQLNNGKWTSKLGKGEDIEHNAPEDVAGGIYGNVTEIMKRPTQ